MGDWSPGDLALCVKSGRITVAGHVYRVSDVSFPNDLHRENGRWTCNRSGATLLRFSGLAHAHAKWAEVERFRKITPGHQIEGSEVDQRNPWKVGQDAVA